MRLRRLGYALAAAAALALGASAGVAPAAADVNDFSFSSFDAEYRLGIDAEGRSTLDTVETFEAVFPETDQNRGIQRALPLDYRGHPTDLRLISVTDAAGTPRPFETETDDENLIVTIRGDEYVHGEQTYVLIYSQSDVTAYFANTDDDEFYRDTNGTLWRQPFAVHTTTTTVAPDLVEALTGDTGCFVGADGSDTPCEITRQADTADGAAVFTTDNRDLGPGENVTIGIAFAPHTFVERDTSFFAGASGWLQLGAVLLGVLAVVLAFAHRFTALRDAPGRPVIIPEYVPPAGEDLLIASVLLKRTPRAAAASFVDFAVRHNIQIVEQTDEGVLASKAVYWLRLLSANGLNPAELELARLLFGPELTPGAWRELKKRDTTLARQITALMQAQRKRALAEGYLRSGIRLRGSLLLIVALVAAVVSFFAGIAGVDAALGGALPIVLIGASILLAIVVSATAFRTPLTSRGAELRDYVVGIEMYLKWAEEDRYRVLQSPEGALRTGVNAPDWGQVVKLYERLLPWAVLLDLETEWAKVLGTYYESLGSQPDWYGGSTAFNAAVFASSIGSMSAASASTYSGSSSSSSSGFSGGGGSSGGGGGGGGGGGV